VGIGGWEIMVIFFVVLLVFGPKRIPEVARGLGKGMRELRRISTDFQREMNLAELDEPMERRPKETPPVIPDALPKPNDDAIARTSARAPETTSRASSQAPEGRE
jgi:TatA/E family protein of Tat protein translocase